MDAGREPHRRRLDRPGDPEHGEERHRRRRRETEAGAAELAAVLRPGQVQQRQHRVREQLREQPGAGEEEERRPKRRAQVEQPGGGHRQPELEQPERHCRPARAGRAAGGGRRATSSASPIRSIRPASSSGHHLCRIGASTAATRTGSERADEPRLDPASQRVGHDHHPAAEAACGDLHPDQRVGRGIRPLAGHAGERERARRVGQRRTRSSRPRARSSGPRSRARAPRRAAPAADRGGSRRGSRWRRSPARRRRPPARRGSGPRARLPRSGASQARPGGYDGSPKPRRSSARRAARRGVEAGEAALREERPGDVERPPRRLAAPDRDDLGARRERVQPLGRRRHAGADDRDARGVLVRLVGVDDARVARELVRHAPGPDDPWRRARAGRRRGRRPRSRRRRRRSARSGRARRSRPSGCARAARRRGGGTRRRSAGSGRGR